MQSLRDKLLKAGLVTEEQAKRAESSAAERPAPPPGGRPRPSSNPSHHGPRGPRPAASRPTHASAGSEPVKYIAVRPQPRSEAPPPVPKLPPMPGSKLDQRLQAKKQLELDRQIRELVQQAQVPLEPGEHAFYFMTRKGKLRRLELTQAQAQRLESGELAVVERPDPAQIEHALVPPETASQLLTLSERSVRFFNRPGAPVGFLSEEALAQGDSAAAAEDQAEPASQAESAAPSPAASSIPEGSESASVPQR